jgi:hypothetical protein
MKTVSKATQNEFRKHRSHKKYIYIHNIITFYPRTFPTENKEYRKEIFQKLEKKIKSTINVW